MTATLDPLLLLPLGSAIVVCLLLAIVVLRIHSAFLHYHHHGYTHLATHATLNGRNKPS